MKSFLQLIPPVQARITNPATGNMGLSSDDVEGTAILLAQFVRLWRNAMTIGAIIVILFYIWGGLEWITSEGDSSKLEKARNRMLHATIGLIILVSSFIIVGFVGWLIFGEAFSIIDLTFYGPNS